MTQVIETNLVEILNKLDQKIDKLDQKIEQSIDKLDQKIEQSIDKLERKIDNLSKEVVELKIGQANE